MQTTGRLHIIPQHIAEESVLQPGSSSTGYFHSRWIARTAMRLHMQGLQRIAGVTKFELLEQHASHALHSRDADTPPYIAVASLLS